MIDEEKLIERAKRAYVSRAKQLGAVDAPGVESGLEIHGGVDYIVLRNIRGVLALFRISKDGEGIHYVESGEYPKSLRP